MILGTKKNFSRPKISYRFISSSLCVIKEYSFYCYKFLNLPPSPAYIIGLAHCKVFALYGETIGILAGGVEEDG